MAWNEWLVGKAERGPPFHPGLSLGVHRGSNQLAGPAPLRSSFLASVSVQELHLLDARLAATASLNQRLHYLQGMKIVRLDPTAVNRHGFLNDRASRKLNRRTPLGQRHAASGHERNFQPLGVVVHRLGPVPAV